MGDHGVGMPQAILLDNFGGLIMDAFGHPCFLVGSALYEKTWHDVDVRLILPDEEYESQGYGNPNYPWDNPRWVAMALAFSELGERMTMLPIDFQIQQMSRANELYEGKRSALGVFAHRNAYKSNG